jgi:hypothetical protein
MTDIVTLKPRKITYSVLVNVHHWSGEHTNSVRIESDTPLGPFVVGERFWIGGLDGFPESRLTMGKGARDQASPRRQHPQSHP